MASGLVMTSQRIMKLLALIAFVAAIAGVMSWRETGETPSPWLIRIAGAALTASFLIFLVNPQTRPRTMLQFLSALFATVALFAFAADYSTAKATGSAFKMTPLIDGLSDFAPTLVAMMRSFIAQNLGEWAWDPVLMSILGFSTEAVFVVLAVICGYAGRRRKEVQIFIN